MSVQHFDETQHPRDPSGQFATKPASESQVSLAADPDPDVAGTVERLRSLDRADQVLADAGMTQDDPARAVLADARADALFDATSGEHVELDSDAIAGRTVAYAKDGTILFADGDWSSVSGPGSRDGAPAPDPHRLPTSDDPDVQAGAVHDTVVADGTTFHRLRPGINPGTPYAFRFQADRPLSDAEVQQAAQLVGYSYAANVRGEPLGDPVRDTPYSFVVGADTTKSRSDDIGMALEEFEEDLPVMFEQGSPVRKTDRAGAGTKGTRLVEGFGDTTPSFEIYADDVWDNGYEEPWQDPAELRVTGQTR